MFLLRQWKLSCFGVACKMYNVGRQGFFVRAQPTFCYGRNSLSLTRSLTHLLTHCVDFVLHMLVLNLLKCVLCWWCCIRRRMAAKTATTRRTKTPPSLMSWRSKRTTKVALPYSSALTYLLYVIFPFSVWDRTCHFLYIYPLTIIASISYFLSWSQFRDCKFSASVHMESVSRANFFSFERFWLLFQVLLNLTSLRFRFLYL